MLTEVQNVQCARAHAWASCLVKTGKTQTCTAAAKCKLMPSSEISSYKHVFQQLSFLIELNISLYDELSPRLDILRWVAYRGFNGL